MSEEKQEKHKCANCGADGPRLKHGVMWFCNWMCQREYQEDEGQTGEDYEEGVQG